jgi:iron complex outermembrane receptor protein
MQQRTKIALAVAVAVHAMTGYAQEQAPQTQRVEVTGSRIRQVDLETAQPVQVMTQEQIQKTGLVTVGDIINNLSSSGTPAFSKGSALTSNREQGGQYIDMRNLGSNRLLVLVNGKRWTQTTAGYTDVSTIPSALIDRVEILKDGASSIYGSDAIAGVVNFILKKEMQGGQISLYEGANQHGGDGKSKDFSATYGAGDEKASMLFGLTHTSQGVVWARDRDITAYSFGPNHQNANYGTGPWGRIRQVGTGGAASGFNQYLNHTGGPLGDGTGSDARNKLNYHTYAGVDADTFNSTSQMNYTEPTRLTSIFTKGSIELPYGMRFTTTAMFADRDSPRQVAGYPLSSTSQPNFPVYVDKNSYYNPYGNGAPGIAAGAGQDLFFYRRTIEVPRVTDNQNRTTHIDAALEGDFAALGRTWNWSVGYNHSASDGNTTSTGNVNLLNLKKALGPSFVNASGAVQCGTAAAPIAPNLCVPFNVLGGPSAATPEALNYIMSTGQGTYGSTVNSATADITGELFNLPAGAVGIAGGIEHRSVNGFDRPGQFEQSGYSTDLAAFTTTGKYNVREAYLETNIPVLKSMPFAELLSFDLASRYSDYSNFGSTHNSKASFMWKPIKDLLTRGTWAQGFRAPALADTFGGGGQTFDAYIDPCDSLYGQGKTAGVTARCAAAGVPANFRQVNQAGAPVPSTGAQTPYPFTTGLGNRDLQPETATTKTIGFVYSPSFITGFSMSLDYFDIDVKNRITGLTVAYELNQCYISGVQDFCNKVTRDGTGQITNLTRGNANLGELATKGVDFSFNYRLPLTPYGQFMVRSDSTYVDAYRIKSTATSDWVSYAGEFGINRVKSTLGLDWSLGNWNATLTSRFYSHIKTHCAFAGDPCSNPNEKTSWGTGYNRQGNMVFSDLSIGYALPWKGRVMVGANNVFNRKPILTYDASSTYGGPSSSSSVDPNMPLDRFFYARYTQSF